MTRTRIACRLGIAALALTIGLPSTAAAQRPDPMPQPRPSGPPGTGHPTAPGQEQKQSKEAEPRGDDRKFATEAAQDGLAEVALGKLATQKASDPAVKAFGQHMVEDHGKANEELKSLAKQKGWTLPDEPAAKHKATQARLEKLEGAAFDSAYAQDMVKDHEHAVAAFERQAKGGGDPDLKAWASKTLPTLKSHLQDSRDLAGKVGKAGKSAKPSSR